MPEQVRFPYGDAFIMGTPQIDRLSNQLYQEQRQRELYRQQQNKALDDELKNILPGIRTGDTDKFANLWNDYKTSWIQLQKTPPKNQADYLRAQQELIQKKANVYNHVRSSKDKADEEKRTGGILSNDKTGRFKDEAYGYVTSGMKLPYDSKLKIIDAKTGKPQEIDWTNPDDLKRHIDTKGVFDAIKTATGTTNEYLGEKENKSDLQIPKIKASNNPRNFYDTMTLAASKNPVDFLNTLPQPTDDEYFNVQKQYNSIDSKVKKMWKMDDGEDLPSDDQLKTPVERAIKYQAMTHALNPNNQPRITGYADDKNAVSESRQKQALQKMGIQDRYIRGRMRLAKGYKEALVDYKSAKDEQEQNGILNKFIDNSYEAGTDKVVSSEGVTKQIKGVDIDGKRYEGKFIDVPKDIKKGYAKYRGKDKKTGEDMWDYPNGFYLTNDKKTLIPLYLGSDTETGGNYLKSDSKPVNIQMYKLPLGKLLLTKKSTGSEVVDDFSGDEQGGYTPKIKTSTTEIHKSTISNSEEVRVQVGNKTFRIPKSNLSKLDSDKVQYKVIK